MGEGSPTKTDLRGNVAYQSYSASRAPKDGASIEEDVQTTIVAASTLSWNLQRTSHVDRSSRMFIHKKLSSRFSA